MGSGEQTAPYGQRRHEIGFGLSDARMTRRLSGAQRFGYARIRWMHKNWYWTRWREAMDALMRMRRAMGRGMRLESVAFGMWVAQSYVD